MYRLSGHLIPSSTFFFAMQSSTRFKFAGIEQKGRQYANQWRRNGRGIRFRFILACTLSWSRPRFQTINNSIQNIFSLIYIQYFSLLSSLDSNILVECYNNLCVCVCVCVMSIHDFLNYYVTVSCFIYHYFSFYMSTFCLGLDMVMESGEDYVVKEVEKTKRKLKDISANLDNQQHLLRLIVQVPNLKKNMTSSHFHIFYENKKTKCSSSENGNKNRSRRC